MYNSARVERYKPDSGLIAVTIYIYTYIGWQHLLAFMCCPDWNDTLYTFCQCILYAVHCIMTVLLKYTISARIVTDVVTSVIFITLLFIKILYNY